MLIARNTVVTLNYSVRDTEGASIDEGTNPLVYLHGGYGGIFDRIEEELQGKAVGDDAQLNMLIKRVREALEPDPRAPRYLITLRGEGFFLYPRGKP